MPAFEAPINRSEARPRRAPDQRATVTQSDPVLDPGQIQQDRQRRPVDDLRRRPLGGGCPGESPLGQQRIEVNRGRLRERLLIMVADYQQDSIVPIREQTFDDPAESGVGGAKALTACFSIRPEEMTDRVRLIEMQDRKIGIQSAHLVDLLDDLGIGGIAKFILRCPRRQHPLRRPMGIGPLGAHHSDEFLIPQHCRGRDPSLPCGRKESLGRRTDFRR